MLTQMWVEKLIGQLYQYISSGGYLMKEPSHLAKYNDDADQQHFFTLSISSHDYISYLMKEPSHQKYNHCHASMGFQNQMLLFTCSMLSHNYISCPSRCCPFMHIWAKKLGYGRHFFIL